MDIKNSNQKSARLEFVKIKDIYERYPRHIICAYADFEELSTLFKKRVVIPDIHVSEGCAIVIFSNIGAYRFLKKKEGKWIL